MSDDTAPVRSKMQAHGLALALFLLAPFIGEWLFGNQPITALGSLVLLAPMYGGGALLIREVARRCGLGWPTMILLAAAYALAEEGPIDQMLWNPLYGGIDFAAAYADTHVPWLGTSGQLVFDALSVHAIWSISVPIALVEAFDPAPRRPWLGLIGLAAVAAIFIAGSAFLAMAQIEADPFVATPWQYATAAIAIIGLVAAAFAQSRYHEAALGAAPRPWLVGLAVFALTSLYFGRDLMSDALSGWNSVALGCGLAVFGFVLLARWSGRAGWTRGHAVAAAGGAVLTYAWVGFDHGRSLDVPPQTTVLGSTVFALASLALLAAAIRSVQGRRG